MTFQIGKIYSVFPNVTHTPTGTLTPKVFVVLNTTLIAVNYSKNRISSRRQSAESAASSTASRYLCTHSALRCSALAASQARRFAPPLKGRTRPSSGVAAAAATATCSSSPCIEPVQCDPEVEKLFDRAGVAQAAAHKVAASTREVHIVFRCTRPSRHVYSSSLCLIFNGSIMFHSASGASEPAG